MNVKELVPKNKFDDSNIGQLYKLTDEEIKPIIYDLLEWLQDGYNHPVAEKVLDVLLKRENLVFPYISEILKGNDVMWKIWIMDLLIPTFSLKHKKELEMDILELVNITLDDEDSLAIKESAIHLYKEYFNNK